LTRDQELNFLKTQAELLKDQLSQIESRINELQTK
jgi:prefoldin subunit 5